MSNRADSYDYYLRIGSLLPFAASIWLGNFLLQRASVTYVALYTLAVLVCICMYLMGRQIKFENDHYYSPFLLSWKEIDVKYINVLFSFWGRVALVRRTNKKFLKLRLFQIGEFRNPGDLHNFINDVNTAKSDSPSCEQQGGVHGL